MTKGWTEERRQRARERILENKPWEHSTGPKTPEGKRKSSINALKHGGRSAYLQEGMKILELNERFIAQALRFQRMDHTRLTMMLDRLEEGRLSKLLQTAPNKLIEVFNQNNHLILPHPHRVSIRTDRNEGGFMA